MCLKLIPKLFLELLQLCMFSSSSSMFGYSKLESSNGMGSIRLRSTDNLLDLDMDMSDVTLEWRDLEVYIPADNTWCRTSGVTNFILSGCQGRVDSGSLVGIMGESGCGKTTLLHALSKGLPAGLTSTGSVSVNGVECRGDMPCTFVPQFDQFIPRLTVREHLFYQAAFRLPRYTSKYLKAAKVTGIVEELNLGKCEHSKIGSRVGERGLSGGEMKRLSVAQELLSDPALILLDEPTSGE